MKFIKMQGLGNDFIVMAGPQELTNEQMAKYCDRYYGIGSDGLIIVSPVDERHVEMKYWNADGTSAEMCGNGLRCATRFAVDNRLIQPGEFIVQTAVGPLNVKYDSNNADNIEVQVGKVTVKDEPVRLHDLTFYEANVGNPHSITFVENTETAPVAALGTQVETDVHFPNKTNVEFVQIISPSKIKIRVWERGVGETLACITAVVACAMTTVKFKEGLLPIEVEVPGGKTNVWLDNTGYSCMKGPAEVIFTGELPI